jgi:hypothetical protein
MSMSAQPLPLQLAQPDAFISYSHEDQKWVRDVLLAQLEKAGLKVLIDYRDFEVGVPVLTNIERAVETSRHTLLVLTPAWLSSKWAEFEGLLVATADPAGRLRRTLPLKLKEVELPPRISYLTPADFTDPSRQAEEMVRLFRALSISEAVQQLLPTQLEKITDYARDGLAALSELARDPDVLPHVVEYRVVFAQASNEIGILTRYKELHERLHELQIHCYNLLIQEIMRFPQEEQAKENLEAVRLTWIKNIELLQLAVKQADYLAKEVHWIQLLINGQQELQEALAKSERKRLEQAKRYLNRVLATQPSLINQHLNIVAHSLPLPQLVEAMSKVRERIGKLNLDPAKVTQFQDGVDGLSGLNETLRGLVSDHDNWQAVDIEMRRIEATLDMVTDELELSWLDLKKQVEQLYPGRAEPWAESLKEASEQLGRAIADPNPVKMRSCFRRYRRQAAERFYLVDLALMKLCDDLRQVGGPLAAVLKAISL